VGVEAAQQRLRDEPGVDRVVAAVDLLLQFLQTHPIFGVVGVGTVGPRIVGRVARP
jgi:hypothetical protein